MDDEDDDYYRFADPSAAQLAPGERGARLRISSGADDTPVELYVHPFVLRACSGVLAELLDGSFGSGSDNEDGGGKASSSGADPHLTVPLDGDDPLAWDEALSLLYGLLRGEPFEVDWDSAERLLVLADKYDMPGVAAPVASFLRAKRSDGAPRLQQQLDGSSGAGVWRWLLLTSRAGLDDLAAICIDEIVGNGHAIAREQLAELRPAVGARLLARLDAARDEAVARVAAAGRCAAAAEARARAAEARARQQGGGAAAAAPSAAGGDQPMQQQQNAPGG